MSRLISRILLTILLFPLASLLYLVIYIMSAQVFRWGWGEQSFILAGVVAWAFAGIYWYLMWSRDVRWTIARITQTFMAAGAATLAGMITGMAVGLIEDDVGVFIGSAAAPLLWLVATTFIWREGGAELGTRHAEGATIVCPMCGYNLAGLTEARCPECGVQYTIDDLFGDNRAGKRRNSPRGHPCRPRHPRRPISRSPPPGSPA